MDSIVDKLTETSVESQEQAIGLIEKLLDVAQPSAVFGQPLEANGQTIITASEVNVGLGFGFGFGGGTAPSEGEEGKKGPKRRRAADPHERVELEPRLLNEESPEPELGEGAGVGGGGGGGGAGGARPVAVISVSDHGVQVEPVVDATKLGLAFFTALGSMFFMLLKMRSAAED